MTDEPDPAFEALLEHAPFLRRLARGLVRDEAGAEDLVQDTFAAALRRPPEDPSGARGWLSSVVRRLWIDQRKAEARRVEREARVARGESETTESGIEERVELARAVLEAVQSLSEPYRSAIWLRYYEERSPRAIARELGVPLETVRTRLRRARSELRAKLDARPGGRREWLAGLAGFAGLRAPGITAATASAGKLALVSTLVGLPIVASVLVARSRDDSPAREPAALPLAALDSGRHVAATEAQIATDRTEADERRPVHEAPGVAQFDAPTLAASPPQPDAILAASVSWSGLEPDGPVHVAMLRARDGRPEGFPLTQATCAAGEILELAVPHGGEVMLVAAALGVPPITVTTTLATGRRTRLEIVEPERAPVLGGRLVDAAGAPLVEAAVFAHSCESRGRPDLHLGPFALDFVAGGFRRPEEESTSGPDGALCFRALGPGPHLIAVRQPPREREYHLTLGPRRRSPIVELPAAGVEIAWTVVSLRIEVRDELGPLDGVWVSHGDFADIERRARGEDEIDLPLSGSTIPPEGVLVAHFDPIDDLAFYFERRGHASALLRLAAAVPDSSGSCVVVLPTSRMRSTLLVRLSSDRGRLPARVQVTLQEGLLDCESGPPLGALVRELEPQDGRVLLDDVPPGRYELTVLPSDGTPFVRATVPIVVAEGANEVDMALELGGFVGLVVDPSLSTDRAHVLHLVDSGASERAIDLGWIDAQKLSSGGPLAHWRAAPPGDWIVELRDGETAIFRGRARVEPGARVRVKLDPVDVEADRE